MYLLELFKKYLLSQQNPPSQLTVKNYLADIRKFISWFQNTFNQEFKAQEVSYETIQQFKAAFASETAISSVERYVSSLRKFFHFLKIEGIISHDPFSDTPHETIEESDPFRLKAFKNFLYVYNASSLTIKNYIIDVKQFFAWTKEVAKNENGKEVTEQEILNSVSNKLLEAYRDRLYTQHIFSPSSINRKLSSLRKYLSWAKEQGVITDSRAHISFVKKPEVAALPQSAIEAILSKETPVVVAQKPHMQEEQAVPTYSPFPPFRLLQKSLSGLDFLIEKIIVTWLLSLINLASNRIWELRGKPVFDKKLARFAIKKPALVTNLPKQLYAPTKMSTKTMTWYQKIWFHLQFTRPEWYRRYQNVAVARYFSLAVLVILSTVIGFTTYYALIGSRGAKSPVLAAAPTAPLRILSFQGRLTDNNGNPITSATNLRFIIYNDPTASAGARLWEEVDRVSPDTDGIFSLLLGSNGSGGNAALCNSGNPPGSPATGACGIPQNLFAQNNALYMGVTVESTAELTPRQQIATVAFATNAEVLQGLPPITDASVTSNANAVLALNSSGVVAIPGSANPTTTIQASSSNIKLTGQTTVVSTNTGSNGDIQLSPDGLGKIDVFRPLQNKSFTGNISTALGAVEIDSIASILATSSGQSAFTINQNSTGPLISASVSGTAKFSVDNTGQVQAASFYDINNTAYFLDPNAVGTAMVVAGSVGIGTTNPANFKLQVAGHVGPDADNLYDLGAASIRWRNIYGAAINASNIYLPVSGGTGGFWQLANNVLTPANVANDLAVGGNGTASATFQAFGSDLNGPAATVAATTNFAGFIVTNTLGDLFTASSSGQTRFVITQSGNIGISTAIPNAPLQVARNGNSVFLGDTTNSSSYINFNNRVFAGYDGSYAIFQGASSHGIRFQTSYGQGWDQGTLVTFQPYGTVTIGTTTYGNGALVVNQQNLSGSGDIFSASASGTTKFTIQNDGTIKSAKYVTAGGILFADTNGIFTQTTGGSNGQCLQSTGGGTPTWGTCGSGGGGSSNWVLDSANGDLTPINETLDILVGGTSTASAKFAVLNIAGGTPTASVSAQDGTNRALSLLGNGTIQGAQNNNITIGGNTTGNITISPLNGGTGSNLFVNALTTTFSGTNPVLTTSGNNNLSVYAGTGTVTLGTTSSGGNVQFFSGSNFITNAGNLTIAGSFTLPNSVVLQGVATQLQVNSSLLVNSTGATGVKTSIDTSGNVLPGSDGSANLGASGDAWNFVYAKNLVTTNLTASNIYLPVSGGTDGFWQLASNVIAPSNIANDLAIGGNSTASAAFQVFGEAKGSVPAGTASTSGQITFNNTNGVIGATNMKQVTIGSATTGAVQIAPNGQTGIYVASNGDIGINTTTINTYSPFNTNRLQIEDPNGNNSDVSLRVAGGSFGQFNFVSNQGTLASPTVSLNNDWLGNMQFIGYDGAAYKTGAEIYAKVDGTPASNSMPTDLNFATTRIGSGNSIVNMLLTSNGFLGIGNSINTTNIGNAQLVVNQNNLMGAGDIFTASQSGTTKFVINNSGNVGIGIRTALAQLETAGATSLSLANGNTTDFAAFDDSTYTNLFRLTATGGIEQIGGQNTPFGGIGNYENLMIYSQGAFSNAAYQAYWSLPTTTDNATQSAAPDGTYTATQAITPGSWPVGSSQGFIQNVSSFPNSGPYTVSIWLKGAVGGEQVQLGANDANSANIITLTTTWKRYSYSTNNLTASGSPRGFQIKLWSLNSTYYLWGAQAERRNYPGVYIATTSSPVVPSPAGYNSGLVINATGSAIFAGKVGIATNSAQYTLDVNGDIRSSGYLRDIVGGVSGANMIPISADAWKDGTSFWKNDPAHGQAGTVTTVATTSAVPTGIVHQFTTSSLAGWYYIDQLIPIDPARTYYGRIWAVRTAGTGTFYSGYIAYDKNMNVLGGNTGTYGYFIASGVNPTASGTWYYGKIQGEGTAVTDFPVGTRYIKPLIIVNYNVGGTMQVSMPEISDRPFEQDDNAYDIATSGISRFYVDTTGNIGIGTTSNIGNAQLVVNQSNNAGTGGDIIAASASGTPEFTVKASGQVQARSFYDLDNTSYFLDPNALTTSMAVAGSVGIGTTTPSSLLQVGDPAGSATRQITSGKWADMSSDSSGYGLFAGNAYTNMSGSTFAYANTHASIGAMGFAVNYPAWNTASVITSNTTSSTAGTAFTPTVITRFNEGSITLATSTTYAMTTGNANSGDLAFGSDASNGYIQSFNSKPLLINSQGNNVGIGTTGTPRSKLDVYGDLTVGTGTIAGDYGMINFPSSDNDNGFIYACSTQNGGCAANTFDLRVYLQDDADNSETFSIWGGSCAHGGCSQGTANAAQVAWISAAGNASFAGQVTVGGTSGVVWSAGSSYEAFVTSTSNLYITDTGHTSPPTINVQKNQHVCISCFNADPKILQVGAGCLNIGTNTCGDVAEYYHASEATDKGDIITIDNNSSASANLDTTGKLVKKSATPYDKGLLGVVSTNPAITIEGNSVGLMAGGYTAEPLHPAVAEVGKVPTKVSTINGIIHSGDRITSSTISGFGMKATQDGVAIGPALEDFDPAHGIGQQIACPADAPPGITCGLIYVYMQSGEYNPNSQLANTNAFSLQKVGTTAYQILDDLGNVVTHVDTFAQAMIANLQVGFVQAEQVTTNSLAVATNNITVAGQSLQDYIISVVQNAGLVSSTHIISPLAEIDTIHTNIISPLSTSGNISLSFENNTLSVRNGTATNSAVVAQIDNSGNATFSGTLKSENLAVNSDATISGTLHAGRIVANEIEGLAATVGTLSAQNITNVTNIYFATPSSAVATAGTGSAQNIASSYNSQLPGGYTNLASFSAYLAYVPQLSATTATFQQGLMSLGPTSLSDTTITGQLAIDGQFILANNSINVLGADLQLQPLGQGGVSIAAGMVRIDQSGNLTVNGKAVFNSTIAAKVISPLPNQDLSVQLGDKDNPNPSSQFKVTNASGSAVFAVNQLGDVIASGTATVAKLNLELAPPAYAVSDTEVQATGSAGTTQINAYQKEITIDNPLVTDKSLIYITPVGNTGQIPVLMRQVPSTSFTVGIPQPNATATQFNWLIVN